jgi:hypothetical protein
MDLVASRDRVLARRDSKTDSGSMKCKGLFYRGVTVSIPCGLLFPMLIWATHNSLTLEEQLYAPSYEVRVQALKTIVGSKTLLADRQLRQIVIRQLTKASEDPQWSELGEGNLYKAYYSGLLETTKKNAIDEHDPTAWTALVLSNFNDFSDF